MDSERGWMHMLRSALGITLTVALIYATVAAICRRGDQDAMHEAWLVDMMSSNTAVPKEQREAWRGRLRSRLWADLGRRLGAPGV